MDMMQLAVQLFKNQLDKDHDGQLEMTEIASAMMGLMGGGQNQAQAGGLAGLASMISGMQGGGDSGLASLASSWLGNGANQQPSGSQLNQMFGQDKIAAFAQQLGISRDQAVSGLQASVPEVVDKASPNGSLDMGSLLDAVGGVQGAIGLASKLFGR
ncbi:YidB family protein [Thiothrix nivea]|uniref:EF-hand domain-containing protein n=1 Tax=Thiothrix nivea (strain ATCC 35100 / DSM 5205 / JP2) TaxID=870187 RepID=A0A656HJX8_THINJ|nr:YidB family protein [Thiothrix nivea]EIJ36532.1 protein of unknown function DUF937 [Thiothrix nivea DSM 5205]